MGNFNSNQVLKASKRTSYPNNISAGYEELLHDDSVVNIPDNGKYTSDPRFHHNLAEYMSEGDLARIGGELTQAIENDDKARAKWLRINIDGLEYLGMGGSRAKAVYTSKSSTDVFGASLMKAALRASAEIYSNLFPASGFMQSEVLGLNNEAQEEHAERVTQGFNYVTTDVMTEYKSDKKQGLLWMCLEGSVFTKVFIDPIKNKPCAPYIRASDIIIDAGASSLADADRISYYFSLSDRLMQDRFDRGGWKRSHVELEDVSNNALQRKLEQKVGVENTTDETNKYYGFYECHTYLDIRGFEHLDQDGEPSGRKLPYIVTKDRNSDTVVSIYRNWNENDPMFQKKEYFTQHKYFPGLNIYGWGMFHLCLGLAKAETEIQQQLIIAAQLSNAPSMMMKAGLRGEKTQIDIKPGSMNPINTFDSNLSDALVPYPFKEPSQVLMVLLQNISQDIEDFSVTREIKPGDLAANMPATAMIGILSTMHTLENSLLNDLYDSFRKEFKLIYTMIGEWLPEEGYPFLVPGGDGKLMKEDFGPDISVRPILDPNISSSAYKMIIGEGLLNLSAQQPDLYNMREVHRRLLTSMQVTDIEEILNPAPEDAPPPPEMDPMSENQTIMSGQPIKAYKNQDHPSHNIVHQDLIDSLTADEATDNTSRIAQLEAHKQEHATFEYILKMQAMTGIELPDDPTQIPPDVQNHIAIQAAKVIQQKQQQEAQQNPPPIDPSVVMMEENRIKEKEIENKAYESQERLQLERQKIDAEAHIEDMKMQVEMKRLEFDERELRVQEEKLALLHEEAQMKLQVEMMKLESDKQQADLTAQSKAFDSTLRFEHDSELGHAKIASDEEKASLDAETRAFDATLQFEKHEAKSVEKSSKDPKHKP